MDEKEDMVDWAEKLEDDRNDELLNTVDLESVMDGTNWKYGLEQCFSYNCTNEL